MSVCVNALGKAADDTESDIAQVAGELECILAASTRRVATADNSQCRQVQEFRVAIDVQDSRWARNLRQQLGIGIVAEADPMMTRFLQPFTLEFVHRAFRI